jgi:hypothetical protein
MANKNGLLSIDYQFQLDGHYYSVLHTPVGQ